MVKILGILDIVAAICFLSISFKIDAPLVFIIVIAGLLCLKGAIFIFDIASILDIAAGILLLLSLFLALPPLFFWIVAAFLALKGILSLVTLS